MSLNNLINPQALAEGQQRVLLVRDVVLGYGKQGKRGEVHVVPTHIAGMLRGNGQATAAPAEEEKAATVDAAATAKPTAKMAPAKIETKN